MWVAKHTIAYNFKCLLVYLYRWVETNHKVVKCVIERAKEQGSSCDGADTAVTSYFDETNVKFIDMCEEQTKRMQIYFT